jgi:hypothetical protein
LLWLEEAVELNRLRPRHLHVTQLLCTDLSQIIFSIKVHTNSNLTTNSDRLNTDWLTEHWMIDWILNDYRLLATQWPRICLLTAYSNLTDQPYFSSSSLYLKSSNHLLPSCISPHLSYYSFLSTLSFHNISLARYSNTRYPKP